MQITFKPVNYSATIVSTLHFSSRIHISSKAVKIVTKSANLITFFDVRYGIMSLGITSANTGR